MSRYARLWVELMRLSVRREPWWCVALALGLLLNVVAFVGFPLALREALDAAEVRLAGEAMLAGAVAAVALSASAVLSTVVDGVRLQVVERVGLTEVESSIARTILDIEGIEHLERPEFLDRVTVVRGAAWGIMNAAWGVVETAVGTLRLVAVLLVLGSVDPVLLLLPPLAAVPLLYDHVASRATSRAETATAGSMRLQRELFRLAGSSSGGREIRLTGAAAHVVGAQRDAWRSAVRGRMRARSRAAAWRFLGWVVFVAGFGAGLVVVVLGAVDGRATTGDVVLTLSIAMSLRSAVADAVSRATAVSYSRRLVEPYLWLREHHAAEGRQAVHDVPTPTGLEHGITLDHVSFRYPGTRRAALDDVSLTLPAGAVVALVGEYGSGKSTLVKLLGRLYRPTSGRITVDGQDVGALDVRSWRRRLSVAFQDFGRYQVSLHESVALGDVGRADDASVAVALDAADASGLVRALPAGTGTALGTQFGGVELSEGQWQKVGLARACMPAQPLLFMLDEPTASLDADAEHAIFVGQMRRARALAAVTGAVTLVVTHRFSTVTDADLIVVMRQGRVVEQGRHVELVDAGGLYAELYSIHATAYSA